LVWFRLIESRVQDLAIVASVLSASPDKVKVFVGFAFFADGMINGPGFLYLNNIPASIF
jgi:hypothetical protein